MAKDLNHIVDHFAAILPRRALDVVVQEGTGMNREIASLQNIHDSSIRNSLEEIGVPVVEVTESFIEENIREHGMDPEDPRTVDRINELLLLENPLIQSV